MMFSFDARETKHNAELRYQCAPAHGLTEDSLNEKADAGVGFDLLGGVRLT
jgi:hypothetical protein